VAGADSTCADSARADVERVKRGGGRLEGVVPGEVDVRGALGIGGAGSVGIGTGVSNRGGRGRAGGGGDGFLRIAKAGRTITSRGGSCWSRMLVGGVAGFGFDGGTKVLQQATGDDDAVGEAHGDEGADVVGGEGVEPEGGEGAGIAGKRRSDFDGPFCGRGRGTVTVDELVGTTWLTGSTASDREMPVFGCRVRWRSAFANM
jgi:hypothetical protein